MSLTQQYLTEVRLRGDVGNLPSTMDAGAQAVVRGATEMRTAIERATGAMNGELAKLNTQARTVSSTIDGSLRSSLDRLGTRIGLVAGGAITAFVGMTGRAVVQLDAFNDVADRTQVSVETLSELVNTLAPFGHGLDAVGAAVGRVNRMLAGSDEESAKATRAIRSLGVETHDTDGRLRSAADVLRDLAVRLDGHEDGTDKAARMTALFGREGAALLPLLRDLAGAKRQDATVTTEQAQAAERLAQQIAALRKQISDLATVIAATLAPRIIELIEQFNVGREAAGGFFSALARYGLTLSGPTEQINRLMGRLDELNAKIARDKALAEGQGSAFGAGARRAAAARVQAMQAEVDQIGRDLQYWRLLAEQRGERANLRSNALYDAPGVKPALPRVPDRASNTRGADVGKLEQQTIEQYDRLLAKLDQLSAVEALQWELTQGRFTQFREGARERLRLAAEQLDAQRQAEVAAGAALARIAEYERREAAEAKAAEDAVRRQNEQLDEAAKRWMDIAEPTRQYLHQLHEIRRLVESGRLTPKQGAAAEWDVQNKIEDLMNPTKGKPEAMGWMSSIESGFRSLFQSIADGSVTMKGVVAGAFELIGNVAMNTLASLATEWVRNMIVSKLMAVKTAFSDISASAARAGAAAFASTAAIPYVGPALAPAAGAAAYSGAMSFASGLSLASAAGGYDIPAGLNPVVQLHEREMVLPAKHADVVREMADDGGGGGRRGGTMNLYVQAADAQSFESMLNRNDRSLEKLARRVERSAGWRRR